LIAEAKAWQMTGLCPGGLDKLTGQRRGGGWKVGI